MDRISFAEWKDGQAVRSRLNIFVATTAALLSAASLAIAEPPAGTKNFNAPGAAPNYFSNESGPVMRQPAPLPAAPQAPARTSRETEEPEGQVEAAAPKAERQVVRTVKARERDRTAHARSRTAGRLNSTAARGRNARPVRVAARVEKPRAAKMAHADPHATNARPVSANRARRPRLGPLRPHWTSHAHLHMAHIPFRKMHGLGNDVVVLDARRDNLAIDNDSALKQPLSFSSALGVVDFSA